MTSDQGSIYERRKEIAIHCVSFENCRSDRVRTYTNANRSYHPIIVFDCFPAAFEAAREWELTPAVVPASLITIA